MGFIQVFTDGGVLKKIKKSKIKNQKCGVAARREYLQHTPLSPLKRGL